MGADSQPTPILSLANGLRRLAMNLGFDGLLGANINPETGLEEINGDLLEADFWPGILPGCPVN